MKSLEEHRLSIKEKVDAKARPGETWLVKRLPVGGMTYQVCLPDTLKGNEVYVGDANLDELDNLMNIARGET